MRSGILLRWPRVAIIISAMLGCSTDGAGPVGPGTNSPSRLHLIVLTGDTLRAHAGDTLGGIRVLVVGPDGLPTRGVSTRFRVLDGGGTVSQHQVRTDGSGVASVDWTLGPHVTELQVLRARVVGGDTTFIFASAGLPPGIQFNGDTGVLAVDTIGSLLAGPLQVGVLLPNGTPVVGATVQFAVTQGGGGVTVPTALTDSDGIASTRWRLGDSAGTQTVTAFVPTVQGPSAHERVFNAIALPGAPVKLTSAIDTIRFDALWDTLQPPVTALDRAGNATLSPVTWSSLSPGVAVGLGPRLLSLSNGSGEVTGTSAGFTITLPVTVEQVPVRIQPTEASVTLRWIGQSTQLDAQVVDRRGVPLPGASVSWQGTPGGAASVSATGQVQAVSPGVARAIASSATLVDTVPIAVIQEPASLVVSPALDTMDLDSVRTPVLSAWDSGGTAIRSPNCQVTSSDTSIITIGASGSLTAALPGMTTLFYHCGTLTASIERVVEGTAIVWSGRRLTTPGSLPGIEPFTITNGRVRVSWSLDEMWERGSVEMDVRNGSTWLPANARHYGDWLYIASSVFTLPTEITVTENSPARIALRLRYGDHWFLPQNHGFADSIQARPYPFVRTIWLARGDNGYYSWIDLFDDLHMNIVEHENGFGGLWGPATIRTNRLEIRTDTLSKTITYDGDPGQPVMGAAVDAAEFMLDGSPVRRLLVPLPEAPFITPVFPGWGYGSVYRYGSPSRSFGVYMYADMAGNGPSASTICRQAWTNAPFPLRAVSEAEFASCGPSSP